MFKNIRLSKKPDSGPRSYIKKTRVENQYQLQPSFANLLPWVEWSDDENVVLLEDLRSVGALLEIKDFSSEAKPKAFIQEKHQQIVQMLSQVVPLHENNPWIVQLFVQDDLTLDVMYRQLEAYAKKQGRESDVFTQHYLSIMKEHFELMSTDKGILTDPLSGLPFRGKTRRIRIAVYRRFSDPKTKAIKHNQVEELNAVVIRMMSQLQQIGIKARRLSGKHFYEWMVRWFNPNPKVTEGKIDQLLKQFPYPKKEEKPFGWNVAQNSLFGDIESTEDGWTFDGVKHKVLILNELSKKIEIGSVSRERDFGDREKYALLDKFPAGSIYTVQIIFESPNAIHKHLKMIKGAAIGKSTLIKHIVEKIENVTRDIDKGDVLVRSVEAIYIRENEVQSLHEQEIELSALLGASGLTFLSSQDELYPSDNYLRFLPFNYNYTFDKKYMYRSTYKYKDAAARLLPLFGRSRGDGMNPLNVHFNRGGEAFYYDQLAKTFKQSNSHMAIFGTTGAGKSVLLNTMIMSLSAIHNPRIVVIEAGGSMDYTQMFLEKYGRKSSALRFIRQYPIAVNPYVEAYKALEQVEHEEALIKSHSITEKSLDDGRCMDELIRNKTNKQCDEVESNSDISQESDGGLDEDRDILNEMALATRTMITGGINEEDKLITRSDMMLINRALIYSMKRCRDNHIEQMLVQHVIESFEILAQDEDNQRIQERLKSFALSMEEYKTGLKAKFINRVSEPLPDEDFLQIELGFLQETKYVDLLNVVFITLLSKILAVAEEGKLSGRPTVLVLDEVHILLKSKMVTTILTLIAKVGRKYNLWLVPATQNVSDFSGEETKKFLALMETWVCLAIESQDELDLITSFKNLSDEEIALIKDIKKYPGLYSEGVLLGRNYRGLFRNIPPRIALALAMTDPDERQYRKEVQEKQGCGVLEAIEWVAEELKSKPTKRITGVGDFHD